MKGTCDQFAWNKKDMDVYEIRNPTSPAAHTSIGEGNDPSLSFRSARAWHSWLAPRQSVVEGKRGEGLT
jgi:hypothetical protein